MRINSLISAENEYGDQLNLVAIPGELISFWKDKWCGTFSLAAAYPALFVFLKILMPQCFSMLDNGCKGIVAPSQKASFPSGVAQSLLNPHMF